MNSPRNPLLAIRVPSEIGRRLDEASKKLGLEKEQVGSLAIQKGIELLLRQLNSNAGEALDSEKGSISTPR
ncbi:putative DNA-binding protein [Haloferula luteola]|uniref:Putative DNA-binding protein n=1 Tax=Haloferula luteola TaxID=595692 RepID=A0A840VC85_9BACT|nr:hypothetical protein [Haloferula luteola]MBB5351419.1 putative DNA-binding protein [Haloferula luteola]